MSRYECQRCGEMCFTTNPPHLCSDIRKRLERQEKAVAIVVGHINTLREHFWTDELVEAVALDIVKALSGRDLGA